MADEIDRSTTVAGDQVVKYEFDEAARGIDEVIAELESWRVEGATHVVLFSGNHRGAKWSRVTFDDWADS